MDGIHTIILLNAHEYYSWCKNSCIMIGKKKVRYFFVIHHTLHLRVSMSKISIRINIIIIKKPWSKLRSVQLFRPFLRVLDYCVQCYSCVATDFVFIKAFKYIYINSDCCTTTNLKRHLNCIVEFFSSFVLLLTSLCICTDPSVLNSIMQFKCLFKLVVVQQSLYYWLLMDQ